MNKTDVFSFFDQLLNFYNINYDNKSGELTNDDILMLTTDTLLRKIK